MTKVKHDFNVTDPNLGNSPGAYERGYADGLNASSYDAVMRFVEAVSHGSEAHRAWLHEAAICFLTGRPLPPVVPG